MNASFRWLALLPLLLLSALAQERSTQGQPPLVLSHITVIDATGAPAQHDMTVVIANGRIAEIGKSSAVGPPRGAQRIDATSKFLIPGLWDMHVHWADTEYLPLFIANGVTGMRIMWGFPIHQDWKRESEAGRLLAPHLYIASPMVEGPKPRWPDSSVSVATEEQARQAVINAKKRGADFIKIYDGLPRTEYFAIADEAKKQNMTFAGHVPISVTASEASSAGQKSFEHLTGILAACSTREREVNEAAKADLEDILAKKEGAQWVPHSRALQKLEIDTYSPEKADALFAVLKRNGTWQCPTLTVLHAVVNLDDTAFTNDPRLKYMPRWAQQMWEPSQAREMYKDAGFTKAGFAKKLEIVGAMQKAGVGLLAGTDTSNAYCMPGFSLHDELGFMVQAGLTPMQALQTATKNPARFVGREKDLGTVEKGKLADLVLLDANPLDDIANTKKIESVIYGGTLYSRTQLDKMLSDVEAKAALLSISEPLMKTIKERDIVAAIRQYHDLKATQPTKYDFSSQGLIEFGYGLLGAKKIPEAIEIFKLSVEVGPTDFNTWDSLADAYFAHEDKDLAVKNYRKALELNPDDTNAVEKLKQLGAQP